MPRHKESKLARQHCLALSQKVGRAPAEDAVRQREQSAADRAARVQAAKLLKDGMRVKTEEGLLGRVVFVNSQTGSIDVRIDGASRTHAYAATALKMV